MITRRHFLEGGLGAAAALLAPRVLAAAAADPTRAGFATALEAEPWRLGFANAAAGTFDGDAELSGTLPEGLSGVLYRNGPAAHELFGTRYQHWFDGDGLVQSFRIGEGGITHRARFVATEKRRREQDAAQLLVPGFGTWLPTMEAGATAAQMNVANISVLPVGDELLALWEGGDAYGIEPRTLDTLGPRPWSAESAGLPFSAHPRIDPDGTIWNFGVAAWAGRLVLYEISPTGKLRRLKLVPVEGLGMIHDFLVTEKSIVVVDPPLRFERDSGAETFLDAHVWHPGAPMRVHVFDKASLAPRRRFELSPGFVFHYGNAWEETDGTIRFDACLYPDPGVMSGLHRDVMSGAPIVPRTYAESVSVTLHADGRSGMERTGRETEFPSIDPRRAGRRYRKLYALGRAGAAAPHPWFNAVVQQDLEGGAPQSFRYPDHVIPEEHLFVPRPGGEAENDGWVVGTALDWKRQRTELSVFDAKRLEDGPVAVGRLPYWVPLGLHGRFVSA